MHVNRSERESLTLSIKGETFEFLCANEVRVSFLKVKGENSYFLLCELIKFERLRRTDAFRRNCGISFEIHDTPGRLKQFLRDLSFITEYEDAYERAYDRLYNLAMRGEGKTCLSGKSRISLR